MINLIPMFPISGGKGMLRLGGSIGVAGTK